MKNRQDLGIKAGDTVRVWQRIEEKGKTRLQAFEGLVLAQKHGNEPGATFTVRRVASGVGVEKIFPLYSPMIDKIEIIKRSKVRRAKLYYIREKAAKEIKRQMRRMTLTHLASVSEIEEKEKMEKAAQVAEAAEAVEKESEVAAEKKEDDVVEKPEETKPEETTEKSKEEDQAVEDEKKETPDSKEEESVEENSTDEEKK